MELPARTLVANCLLSALFFCLSLRLLTVMLLFTNHGWAVAAIITISSSHGHCMAAWATKFCLALRIVVLLKTNDSQPPCCGTQVYHYYLFDSDRQNHQIQQTAIILKKKTARPLSVCLSSSPRSTSGLCSTKQAQVLHWVCTFVVNQTKLEYYYISLRSWLVVHPGMIFLMISAMAHNII